MPFGSSVMNYAKNAIGSAQYAGMAGAGKLAGKLAGMGPTGRLGASALAGGAYGATFGRDPGQGRIGGFMGGAMGGAALYGAGRYGGAAASAGLRAARYGGGASTSGIGRLAMGARAAGRTAYRTASVDAMRSKRAIGNTMTNAYGKIRSTLKR